MWHILAWGSDKHLSPALSFPREGDQDWIEDTCPEPYAAICWGLKPLFLPRGQKAICASILWVIKQTTHACHAPGTVFRSRELSLSLGASFPSFPTETKCRSLCSLELGSFCWDKHYLLQQALETPFLPLPHPNHTHSLALPKHTEHQGSSVTLRYHFLLFTNSAQGCGLRSLNVRV